MSFLILRDAVNHSDLPIVQSEMRIQQETVRSENALAQFMEQMKSIMQAVNEENNQLKQRLDALQKENSEADALNITRRQETLKTIDALELQLSLLQKMNDANATTHHTLTKNVKDLTDSNQSLNQTVATLSNDNNRLEKDLDQMSAARAEWFLMHSGSNY